MRGYVRSVRGRAYHYIIIIIFKRYRRRHRDVSTLSGSRPSVAARHVPRVYRLISATVYTCRLSAAPTSYAPRALADRVFGTAPPLVGDASAAVRCRSPSRYRVVIVISDAYSHVIPIVLL